MFADNAVRAKRERLRTELELEGSVQLKDARKPSQMPEHPLDFLRNEVVYFKNLLMIQGECCVVFCELQAYFC